jgi:predicted enzyme related to lactoylglutathione lyase
MEKVTGIGGVFIKAKDAQLMADWYQKHLGVNFDGNLYMNFPWVNKNNPKVPGNTVFSFFKSESDYFEPSESRFMINFRVKNLEELLKSLKEAGIEKISELNEDYGKFAWILDPEGNKIELWEPADEKL